MCFDHGSFSTICYWGLSLTRSPVYATFADILDRSYAITASQDISIKGWQPVVKGLVCRGGVVLRLPTYFFRLFIAQNRVGISVSSLLVSLSRRVGSGPVRGLTGVRGSRFRRSPLRWPPTILIAAIWPIPVPTITGDWFTTATDLLSSTLQKSNVLRIRIAYLGDFNKWLDLLKRDRNLFIY